MVQTDENSELVSCGISGTEGGAKQFQLCNIRTVSELSLPSQSINMDEMKRVWPHLTDIPFNSFSNAHPVILIGQDNILLTAPRTIRHAKWNDPVATKTWLGWVVHGTTTLQKRVDKVLIHHLCSEIDKDNDEQLNELIKSSFSVDDFGVKLSNKTILSREDARAEAILEKTVKRAGTHFEAGLLWRSDDIAFPPSKQTALRRLRCMEKKMDQDSTFAELYCQKIEEYLEKGYARKLTVAQASVETPHTWYIPHFAVTNVHKPGKIRMVFDAACKSQGVSLNSSLLKGPALLNDLPAVLWRFRQQRIAFTADVQEMFHQVKIREADLDSQRFLWRGRNRDKPVETYVMKAMIFGATCSPSTAIYVMQKNFEEFMDEFPDIARAIKHNYYMDDYLDSQDTEEAALKRIRDMIEVQRRCGFNLRTWACSSKAVLAQIPTDLRANAWKELDADSQLPSERVLGLWWNPESDVFTFRFNEIKFDKQISNGKPTKREILKMMASVFDPLGIIAHFTVKARIIFQNIWRAGVQWDDTIPEDLRDLWLKWCSDLPLINTVAVPRCYSQSLHFHTIPELHVFADASEEAYAAVAYFRWRDEVVTTSFVCGKTRVAPLKPLTIPRLELMAALMAARLAETIKKEHDHEIQSVTFWSDSRTVLSWIRSDAAKFKQFVANRLGEIQELTTSDQWRWVPTIENVADDATRSRSTSSFEPTARWYTGPPFLMLEPNNWPSLPRDDGHDHIDTEAKKTFVGLTNVRLIDPLPDVKRFSSWLKLIRSTAWVMRFVLNILGSEKNLNDLSLEEILNAEKRWWRKVQGDSFAVEIAHLQSLKPVPADSKLNTLYPYLDENKVLRVRGRVENSDLLSTDTKFPVILDGKHPWTRLLIHHYHVLAMHQGVETVINNLRDKYWITSMRSSVKHCFRACQECVVRRAKPSTPLMAPLPGTRVNSSFRPFSITGVDFFGPITVKVGRRKEKRYGVLFTCFAVRAIHIEVAHSLSSDSTLMAIRRFVSRRGSPSDLYSDNGCNFKGASNELKAALHNLDHHQMSESPRQSD